MTNPKKTSSGVGSLAAKTLHDPNASGVAKRLAGSALTQRDAHKQTGGTLEDVAAKALADPRSSATTKKLAGSVVAQSNRKR